MYYLNKNDQFYNLKNGYMTTSDFTSNGCAGMNSIFCVIRIKYG